MKTVGDVLQSTRLAKQLTLADIEKKTKIRQKFLHALEENTFDLLPSHAYAKGFLKTYATLLRLDAEQLLALYRRQREIQEREAVTPPVASEPLQKPLWQLTVNRVLLFVFIVVFAVLGGYFYRQYQNLDKPPQLLIVNPAENMTTSEEKIAVYGETDADATVVINDFPVSLDEKGAFFEEIPLSRDQTVIIVEATSRRGKKTTVTRTVRLSR